jgi:hypothetical protein
MRKSSTSPASTAQKLIFWIVFGLTSAALAFAAVLVWNVTRGPGAPDPNPHFAGAPAPGADDEEEEAGDAALTDQEREHLDEILRDRAAGKTAPR